MPNNLPLIGTAVSGIGDLFGIFAGLHQQHLASKIHPQFTPYQTSPYAKQELGLAQQLYGGLMPGYNQEQQQIANNGANYNYNVQKNATDSAQALSLNGLAQGQTNQAYSNLGIQQGQYQSQQEANLNDAYKAMTEEGDKSYQSMLDKYKSDVATQNALRGYGVQNAVGGANAFGANMIAYGNYKNSQ